MDNMYCKKCKTAMIRCPECGSRGKKGANRCIRCKGTGYLCHAHGAGHGHPRKA